MALLVVAVSLFGGCAFLPETFIEPRAPGGRAQKGLCPPQQFLLFERDGVVMAVHTRFSGSGRRTIWLSFEVPAHRRVRLLGSTLETTTAAGGRASSPISGMWYGSKNQSVAVRPESLMVGRTERLRMGTNTGYGMTRHSFFHFSAEYATALGDTFTVTLPKVTVDGFPWDLPPVQFERVRRWILTPFNC